MTDGDVGFAGREAGNPTSLAEELITEKAALAEAYLDYVAAAISKKHTIIHYIRRYLRINHSLQRECINHVSPHRLDDTCLTIMRDKHQYTIDEHRRYDPIGSEA